VWFPSCPPAAQCTTAKGGCAIYAGPYEQQLAAARARQRDPGWGADYRATRPKVERKIGHLTRRRHGGRRARVRGRHKDRRTEATGQARDIATSEIRVEQPH
jgi:Transposase DDE domain